MSIALKKKVTDKEAVEAAYILKSYAREHTFKDSIFPSIDQKAFYNMVVPSPYRITEEDKKLLEGLSVVGAEKIRTTKDGVFWVKIEDHREIVCELPRSVLKTLQEEKMDYDIRELITGELQVYEGK